MKRRSYLDGLKKRYPDRYIDLMVRRRVNAELRKRTLLEEQTKRIEMLMEDIGSRSLTKEDEIEMWKAWVILTVLVLK